MWVYRASDLVDVKEGRKQPWDVKPTVIAKLPGPVEQSPEFFGATYDPVTRRLYASLMAGGEPTVYVWQIGTGSTPPPPPAPVDCVGTWGNWTRVAGSETACRAAGFRDVTEQQLFTVTTPPLNGGLACPVSPATQVVPEACTPPVVTVTYTCWVTSVGATYADGDARRTIRCDTNGPITSLPNGTTFTVSVPKK